MNQRLNKRHGWRSACLMMAFLISQSMGQGQQDDADRLQIESVENAVEVKIGDQLFTRYITNDETKPTFFPVYGPDQIPMTRSFPLAEAEGEAKDHPHHKSIWLGHEINGLDFWSNKHGVIQVDELVEIDQADNSFTVLNRWKRRDDDSIVCTVETKFTFGFDDTARWIDAEITFKASHGDITFNDTKEGMFAIRTHPNLRLAPVSAGAASGNAINSEGISGKAIWGKSAKWVNYWGAINGKSVGVAIMDHPSNFRHPTHWHAREYGLVAANPFGLHHFTGADKGDGEHTIPEANEMKFKYRMLFHRGNHDDANVTQRFQDFEAAK